MENENGKCRREGRKAGGQEGKISNPSPYHLINQIINLLLRHVHFFFKGYNIYGIDKRNITERRENEYY